MQELWPACGGRTSVGTTFARLPFVKSRRRASGVSQTTSFGDDHVGSLRSVIVSTQRSRSRVMDHGPFPRLNACAE